MIHPNIFTSFVWKITVIGCVAAYPDKYEVKDTDTNTKFDLLDVLKQDMEHRRNSIDDPFENWKGKWLPSKPGEPTPPPKVFHKNSDSSHQDSSNTEAHHDDRIPMGVPTSVCDDGKTNLTVDWDYSESSYACFGKKIVPKNLYAEEYCETIPKQYVAIHRCMTTTIEYDEDIPLYGTHRPIWPVYGEYKYVPVQRWLHSLEHGAVVMLYHPCANNEEVKSLKELVKGCIKRHIITPYNLLHEERPLALVTWGCRLTMSQVNKNVVTKFIQERALHAPENQVWMDGNFNDQLIEKANIVSDEQDSSICSKLM